MSQPIIPKEELEAARRHMSERARNKREIYNQELFASMVQQQAKTVTALEEISSELQQANITLTAILKATQNPR
jgi:MarR-like DNA-binding transcriptional regulator SgrR of sgrS sRNA